MPFLSSATGDPQELRRRIAPQASRGVPPLESAYRDFRSNGGPIIIEAGEIERAIISPSGEPLRNLTGKLTIGGSPFDFGDVDPANVGFILALLNLFGSYDFTDNTTWQRWVMSTRGGTDAPDYLALLNDDDILPRYRIKDLQVSSITVGATPGGNFRVTVGWVAAEHDFHGAVVQTEGGKASLSISGITRSGSTATATAAAPHGLVTGDVVVVSGAAQAEYNGDFVITVTGASTFTYTVSGTPVSPATGTIVYATNGLSVTGITRSGSTATATAAVAHGLATGDTVRISGAAETEYNGDVVVTVTGATTFTYTVTGTPATPATGTIIYEKLDATLPIFSNTWEGNWEDDATDRDLYFELVSVDANGVWTTRAKVSAAAAFSSTFTVEPGLDSADNPIYTRVFDESGGGVGPWSEQVRVHLPAGGTYRAGDTFRVPKRRTARWAQTLDIDRPIGSVNLELRLDDEPIRFEEGVEITLSRPVEVLPDTPGRQGATVLRQGPLTAVVTPSRRITDLRIQKALHQGSVLSAVLDARTDVEIGSTGRAYRAVWMLPSCKAFGPMFGTAAGGTNRTEAPRLVAGVPDSPFTYDGITTSAHAAVVIENDVLNTDIL